MFISDKNHYYNIFLNNASTNTIHTYIYIYAQKNFFYYLIKDKNIKKMLKKIFIIFIFINAILTFDSNVREFKNSLLLINQGIIYILNKFYFYKFNKIYHKLKDNVVLNTPDDEVSFFAIGDWGGLPVFPFRFVYLIIYLIKM